MNDLKDPMSQLLILNRFNPDRFSAAGSKGRPTIAFSPYGFAGKRQCPGYRFAYIESSILLCTVLQKVIMIMYFIVTVCETSCLCVCVSHFYSLYLSFCGSDFDDTLWKCWNLGPIGIKVCLVVTSF